MNEIVFDEHDEYFRFPGGAVESPGALRLRLKLKRGILAGAAAFCRPDDGEAAPMEMRFCGAAGSYDVYEAELYFFNAGLYWYHFQIYAAGNAAGFRYPESGDLQITVFSPAFPSPEWIKGGVIYHIFVDRFRLCGKPRPRPGAVFREDWGGLPHYLPDENGLIQNNDFFCGNLDGIIEKLPYLEELGVTCIYLSPVFEAQSNHKYDTGDLLRVDASFGGDEALERLCEKAGERGMRVILDGVFNHVGADSRYFNRSGIYDSVGAYQSRQSPYFDWFTFREWNRTYDSWWGIELLPALNKNSGGYKSFVCGEDGVIARWMKKGVSGWRLDVVDELPDSFLYPLCGAIKREKPDALIVGEVWEDASTKISYGVRRRYLQGGQLDSVTNYPLKDAIIAFVKHGDAEKLAAVMDGLCLSYPEDVLNSLMNILGTHDTARVLTVLGSDALPDSREAMARYSLGPERLCEAKRLLKLASALQFTLPGVPCVYYGDEAGMEGGADPFNRRCFPWGGEDMELIRWYRELAGLRGSLSCFRDGKYELKEARAGFFAFKRKNREQSVLVAVNASGGDRVLGEDEYNFDLLKNEYIDRKTVGAGKAAFFAVGKKD